MKYFKQAFIVLGVLLIAFSVSSYADMAFSDLILFILTLSVPVTLIVLVILVLKHGEEPDKTFDEYWYQDSDKRRSN